MDLERVGWHTSVRDLLQRPDSYFVDHHVFQVFIGSPRTLSVPSITDCLLHKLTK